MLGAMSANLVLVLLLVDCVTGAMIREPGILPVPSPTSGGGIPQNPGVGERLVYSLLTGPLIVLKLIDSWTST